MVIMELRSKRCLDPATSVVFTIPRLSRGTETLAAAVCAEGSRLSLAACNEL